MWRPRVVKQAAGKLGQQKAIEQDSLTARKEDVTEEHMGGEARNQATRGNEQTRKDRRH